MDHKLKEVTDSSYDEEIKEGMVLVNFSAAWCGPCKMMKPALSSYSEANQEKIKVVTLDVDNNPESTVKNNVRGIPTLVLYKNGQEISRKVGSLTISQMEAWISSV